MRMNYAFIAVATTFILLSADCLAQDGGNHDDNGNKYISGTDYSNGHISKKDNRASLTGYNVVKFSLLSWIEGNIPFYYERRVTPWLGLQVGLGLTTRDFIADGVTYIIDGLKDNPPANYNNYAFYASQGRNASVGVYASFQPKFYPRSHALTGFFVSPMVEFKRYDFRAKYVDPTVISDEDQPTYLNSSMSEYRNTVDFTINLGRQWLLHNGVSLELMGGVGFRRLWEQRRFINETDVYNQITGNTAQSYTSYLSWYNTYRPEFNLSLLIGGYF